MTIDGWIMMALIVAVVSFTFNGGIRHPERIRAKANQKSD